MLQVKDVRDTILLAALGPYDKTRFRLDQVRINVVGTNTRIAPVPVSELKAWRAGPTWAKIGPVVTDSLGTEVVDGADRVPIAGESIRMRVPIVGVRADLFVLVQAAGHRMSCYSLSHDLKRQTPHVAARSIEALRFFALAHAFLQRFEWTNAKLRRVMQPWEACARCSASQRYECKCLS